MLPPQAREFSEGRYPNITASSLACASATTMPRSSNGKQTRFGLKKPRGYKSDPQALSVSWMLIATRSKHRGLASARQYRSTQTTLVQVAKVPWNHPFQDQLTAPSFPSSRRPAPATHDPVTHMSANSKCRISALLWGAQTDPFTASSAVPEGGVLRCICPATRRLRVCEQA